MERAVPLAVTTCLTVAALFVFRRRKPGSSKKQGEITTQVKGRTFLRPFGLGPFGLGGTVTGSTAPGWESVRAAFEDNFAKNLELGAQLVVYHGSTKVVDLVGYSSKQPGYTAETLQCVFSCGKKHGGCGLGHAG